LTNVPASPASFWLRAEAEPGRLALVEPDGRRLVAGVLAARCHALVHGLRARGLAHGDAVAVLLPNGEPLVATLLAVMQAGWHWVPINTSLTAGEVAWILADSGAKAFVAHERFADVAAAAAAEAGVAAAGRIGVGVVQGFAAFDAVLEGQPATRPEGRLAGQFMQYTSGTTGRPKAVQRSTPALDPDQMAALLAPNLSRYDITPGGDHVHLVTSPMYHMAPLSFGYFSLHFGHPVVLMDRFDPERALAEIERHRVTTTHMVPTQFHRLLLLPEATRRRYDVSSLRHVMHAAAPCPVELKRKMLEWWGPVIYEYYGASEGGGTLVRAAEWLERPGSVGRPWPGAGVRVLDDDGKDLPAGETGTVYLKLIMDFAYRGDPEKTRASRRGEWFTVGDVGWLDADGYLFLCDRKIDMIITGGVNVYPAEVEAALLAHPEVGDAAVFGIPHPEWGEEVKAVVEPAPGVTADAALASLLLAHCRERLAGYKCPRSIDFAAALPRDANGKLYKRRLRDPYWAGRERKI
jgi:long-chain acyl-CoA synthetase